MQVKDVSWGTIAFETNEAKGQLATNDKLDM